MKVLTMQLNSITIMDLIAYGGAALGVILATTQFRSGHVDLADCILIILLAADFFLPMRMLGSFFHIAMNGMAASDKIFRLLDFPEPEQKTGIISADCSIECKKLRFSYEADRDNLLIARPNAGEDTLWQVLEQVNLADFLRSEKGLDTVLNEKASNLSGGQFQRLALARALLHDSPVYIFDEATSNIDLESENDIMREIRALAKTKTVILISHRLANVAGADNIYVLDKGNVVESGDHNTLLAMDSTYAKLWNAQQELEQYQRPSPLGRVPRRGGRGVEPIVQASSVTANAVPPSPEGKALKGGVQE